MQITRSGQETAREAVQVFGGRGITKTGMGKFIEMVRSHHLWHPSFTEIVSVSLLSSTELFPSTPFSEEVRRVSLKSPTGILKIDADPFFPTLQLKMFSETWVFARRSVICPRTLDYSDIHSTRAFDEQPRMAISLDIFWAQLNSGFWGGSCSIYHNYDHTPCCIITVS